MRLRERITRIEGRIRDARKSLFPPDNDGFMAALVGEDKKPLYEREGGFDFLQALKDTAPNSWNEN